jgi:imidazolonepropionase
MAELILINASPLITMRGDPNPRHGKQMSELGTIENGAVAIDNGTILETGTTEEILGRFGERKGATEKTAVIDARNRMVIPGFVDCHTHMVYAGERYREFARRMAGASHLDILNEGGGILSTVKETRKATRQKLADVAKSRAALMLAHGTTAVEIKSGYGLDIETEEAILDTAITIGTDTPITVVPTYLGAQALPPETDRKHYIDLVVNEAIPRFAGKARYCDAICDLGAFSVSEVEQILGKAAGLGYGLKIHAGQFSSIGAAGLAARLGAQSADHLEFVEEWEIEEMNRAGTIAVFLPGSPSFLHSEEYPDARSILNAGIPAAIATDFNPGSCPSLSMQFMISLAVTKLGMTAERRSSAATIIAPTRAE